MTFSPCDHPFLGGLLGDEEIAGYFSAEADLRAMFAFEAALARAEAAAGIIPAAAAAAIAKVAASFSPDMDRLRVAASTDGVVVPELIRQLRQAVGQPHTRHVHFGATSQDVIDTSLMLRLKPSLDIIANRAEILIRAFRQLSSRFGANPLMGRTRMQTAIEITAADRIGGWLGPTERNHARLLAYLDVGLPVQFGGASGTLDKLGDKAGQVRAALAAELGLADAPQWHSQRDRIAELASILSLITGSAGKFGQDVALLGQSGSDEIDLAGGGSSSAMPHKQNPVAAETLVALARFNATQLAGMHHALVHEQERSGAAWTLEWMILPQMICATAASLRHAVELVGSIRRLGRRD